MADLRPRPPTDIETRARDTAVMAAALTKHLTDPAILAQLARMPVHVAVLRQAIAELQILAERLPAPEGEPDANPDSGPEAL
jgi:hypothetical protein